MHDWSTPPPRKRSGKWAGILVSCVMLFGGCVAVGKDAEDHKQAARPTTAVEFAAAKTPGDLPSEYVSFQPDQYLSPAVSVVEGRRYRETFYYTVVKVGSRHAVVRSMRGVAGRITAVATTSEYTGTREAMRMKPNARFLPYSFDADAKPPTDFSALGAAGGFVMLAGAVTMSLSIYGGGSKNEQYGHFAEPPPAGWNWTSAR